MENEGCTIDDIKSALIAECAQTDLFTRVRSGSQSLAETRPIFGSASFRLSAVARRGSEAPNSNDGRDADFEALSAENGALRQQLQSERAARAQLERRLSDFEELSTAKERQSRREIALRSAELCKLRAKVTTQSKELHSLKQSANNASKAQLIVSARLPRTERAANRETDIAFYVAEENSKRNDELSAAIAAYFEGARRLRRIAARALADRREYICARGADAIAAPKLFEGDFDENSALKNLIAAPNVEKVFAEIAAAIAFADAFDRRFVDGFAGDRRARNGGETRPFAQNANEIFEKLDALEEQIKAITAKSALCNSALRNESVAAFVARETAALGAVIEKLSAERERGDKLRENAAKELIC